MSLVIEHHTIADGGVFSVRIPWKLDTCSAANWSLVPSQTGHLFQAKLTPWA